MTDPDSDREILEETWRIYEEEFAEHVGDVVTPYDFVDTDEQVAWAARIFMFGYGLGSVAGAHAAAPGAVEGEADAERVSEVVRTVVEIAESPEFEASAEKVSEDFLG